MAAFEKGEISMFITVLVTVCLDLAVQGTLRDYASRELKPGSSLDGWLHGA
jgi:hypothetical protein